MPDGSSGQDDPLLGAPLQSIDKPNPAKLVDLDTEQQMVSMIFGMLVGIERQWHHKNAGIKTNTLVSVGATAFALISARGFGPTNNPAANATASKPAVAAPTQPQPQVHTGPTATTSGGAPASSPQGDSPPGMQPHPNDRKQDIVPKK